VRKASHCGTVAASNNRDHPTRSLYYCLFAQHIYVCVVLRAHPVRGELHIQCNANGDVAALMNVFQLQYNNKNVAVNDVS